MKKITIPAISLLLCLYPIGCGSSDRSQQDKEQLTAQAADMAQEACEQELESPQDAPKMPKIGKRLWAKTIMQVIPLTKMGLILLKVRRFNIKCC